MNGILNGLLSGNPEIDINSLKLLSDNELDGLAENLGRVKNINPKGYVNTKQCIRKERDKRAKEKYHRNPSETKLTSALAKFQNRLGLIEDPEIRKALADGKAVASDFELYAVKKSYKHSY